MNKRMFMRNERGSVAVMFAVLLPVLLIIFGGIIDFGAALTVRTQAHSATDAASIAGVKFGYNFAKRDEMARRYFLANYPEKKWGVAYEEQDIRVAESGKGVIISTPSNKAYNSILLSLADIKSLSVNATSQLTAGVGADYDIVLVIDRSGSMTTFDASVGKSRINAAVDVAEEFVQNVINAADVNARVAVAFFYGGPFVGTSGRSFISKRLSNDLSYFQGIPRSATGGTCGACGLYEAIKIFRGQEPFHTPRADNLKVSENKIVIVLSDGEFNIGNATAAANEIKSTWPTAQIYSIFLGGGSTEAMTIATNDPSGRPLYFEAANALEMEKIFSKIGAKVSMIRMVQ